MGKGQGAAYTKIAHNSGRRPSIPRKRPRKIARPGHVDKYAGGGRDAGR